MTQVAAQHGVHPGPLHWWKRQALENCLPSPKRSNRRRKRASSNWPSSIPNWQTHHAVEVAHKIWTRPRARCAALTVQTALLGIYRTILYYRAAGPDALKVALKHRTDAICTTRTFYRSRRITARLQHKGYAVNRKRIQSYMRENRLAAYLFERGRILVLS